LRTLEELSMNAWPAFHTLLLDGWVLRFAEGYTRRANSVAPLYPSRWDLQDKISACEAHYRARGLPVIFKLTAESQPPELDRALAARGYRSEAHTAVQALDLRLWEGGQNGGTRLSGRLTPQWHTDFCAVSGLPSRHYETHWRILQAIQPECCCASLVAGDRVVGCALGVLQDGYLGLYDMVVDGAFRGRGYGERIVRDILAWGRARGGHTAYLQVMLDNPPALRLYQKVGYREAYTYWYRVKE
jgi:ribosomal protein S18 acetylase RimI-like enzyme